MAKFCSNCGSALPEDAKFCENCGARVIASVKTSRQEPARVWPEEAEYERSYNPELSSDAGHGKVRLGYPSLGFSDRVNDPEIKAAVKKNRKAGGVCGLFIIPLPLIGFILYSMITGEMELDLAVKGGLFVSAVFLFFAIYSRIKSRAANSYEAVVIDKERKLSRSNNNKNDIDIYSYYTYVRTTDGKKKTIVESDRGRVWAYEYLAVGDRFRYYPQFAFPYELYDKSKSDCIYCVGCGTKNSLTADRCKKCNLPLLK